MPTFKVNSPDGRVIEIEAPADATDADLIALAQARPAAAFGNVAPTGSERLLSSVPGRIAKGMKDPVDAAAQLLPRGLSFVASAGGLLPNAASNWLDSEAHRVDTMNADGERDYQTARWKAGQTGFDGARLTGNVASPANLAVASRLPAAASTLGRAGAGLLGGAVGGLLQPVNELTGGEDGPSFAARKTGQIAVGAVGGGLLGPVLGKVTDIAAPRVKGLLSWLDGGKAALRQAYQDADAAVGRALNDIGEQAGSLPGSMVNELRAQLFNSLQSGQRLEPAAQLRKMDFEAQGVPALTGQITRDPRQYSSELNLRGVAGIGEPVQNLLAAQNQKIGADLAKFGAGQAKDRFTAGDMLQSALQKLDDRLSGEVRRAYTNARASTGKDWDVPMQGLAGDVQNVIDTFGVGGERNAVPSAIAAKLRSFGIVGDPGMTQRKVFNFEEADKLLKQINAHDDGGNASLGALRTAVKQAISQPGVGAEDPFRVARQMAADRFSMLDAIPALDAAARGKVSADDFVQRFIVGGKTRDLQKLVEVLPADAMAEAKRQISKVIYDGAFKGDAAGDKLASASGLKNAMQSIGPEKLKLFFSPKEVEELNRLTRITGYANAEPAWGTVARGGNPGGVLFDTLARSTAPGVGKFLPLLGTLQQSRQAASALTGAVPKAANLSPQEVRMVSGLLGTINVGAGGLLAP